MAKAATASRAPRGTKTLTQAFFSAADDIPADRRDAVVKAAVAAIRDTLKQASEKAKATRAKTKTSRPTARGRAAAPGTSNRRTTPKSRKAAVAKRSRQAAGVSRAASAAE
jgi:hypothetical protein